MILDLRHLTTRFGSVTPVRDVSLSIPAGETLALVGESGSGKTVTGLSILRLLPGNASLSGEIVFDGQDLTKLDEETMRLLRGHRIAMVFQEPMTSLNPVYTIGEQIAEPLRIHLGQSHREAAQGAVKALQSVGIPDAAERALRYPHQFSGGMRQRAMIAMALACNPALLIADEPTTALDVTIQAQILDLLRAMQQARGMSMLFVSHNLGVVADIAHRVAVMYAGRIVEIGPVREVLHHPRHPYTAGLLASMPRVGHAAAARARGERLAAIPGNVPALRDLPPGCAFAPRCGLASDRCRTEVPVSDQVGDDHLAACFHWRDRA